MNMETTMSIWGGGEGSGCNPSAGKCGRPMKTTPPEDVKKMDLGFYVKVRVRHTSPAKTIYLEHPRYIERRGMAFISGHEVDNLAEGVSMKGSVMHLIQLGEGVTVVPQETDKKYGNLKDKK